MGENSIVRFYKFKSVNDFLQSISYDGELYKIFRQRKFVFRGHASNIYKLIPSALRPEFKQRINQFSLSGEDSEWSDSEFIQILKEYSILCDFYKQCDIKGLITEDIYRIRKHYLDNEAISIMKNNELWIPEDLWTIAALAQHYGLPTRLLDWTHDIFIALYFMVEDYLENRNIPSETDHMELWALNTFDLSSNQLDELPLKIVHPIYYGNPNLEAQQGLFTLWQVRKPFVKKNEEGIDVIDINLKLSTTPLEILLDENKTSLKYMDTPLLYCIHLSKDYSKDIYDFINGLGYNASRIYPGYHGVAQSLRHDYYLKEDLLKDLPGAILSR